MNAYDRLMAEAVPTGTFGRSRPTQARDTAPAPAWTPEEQARHLAVLEAELNAYGRHPRRPRLRVIDGQAA